MSKTNLRLLFLSGLIVSGIGTAHPFDYLSASKTTSDPQINPKQRLEFEAGPVISGATNGETYSIRLPANPKTGKSETIRLTIPPVSIAPDQAQEDKTPEALAKPLTARAINPTAPNIQTQLLTGNFTDTDGDGMTDAAELKYGFDPNSSESFPAEPTQIISQDISVAGSAINATYEVIGTGIKIRWHNPSDGNYSLTLNNESQQLYYGGHYAEHADVIYSVFNLSGSEILTGHFTKYGLDNGWIETYSEFSIDLSTITKPTAGYSNNKISYSFKEFPTDAEQAYRDFLRRVWPIMYKRLGPPAESFNCVITNMGEDSSYFMITEGGRKFLSDTDFIPRLIVHEFVHAWKGSYTFTSDENWKYDNALSGFEEGTAEGMAFEIIHEYVRSYPNDPATLQLLDWRPYQYWSSRTTYYDAIKYDRWSGAGDFWTHSGGQTNRYSIAATTFQIMMKENPNTYKEIMQRYFAKINSNPEWRPNREDILDIWAQTTPSINGIETKTYINQIPVFQGHKLNEGLYILSTIRPYGSSGDQQLAVSYAPSDGQIWWGILKTVFTSYNIPSWIDYMDSIPPDSYYYINTQNQPLTVDIKNTKGERTFLIQTSTNDLSSGNWPLGFGWKMVYEADLSNFPVGLYKETVVFDNYIQHVAEAKDNFYIFGYQGLNQDRYNEYIIMVGIDGITDGSIRLLVDSIEYTEPIINGAAIFRSQTWPFDLEGKITITVTDSTGRQQTYYRTLLEAGTIHNYFQTQFIILDKDFDGIEDVYEDKTLEPEVDTDGDGTPDSADTDDDNDGLTDLEEQQLGTNPTNKDSDRDGLEDGWEVENNLDPSDGICPSYICGSGIWRKLIPLLQSGVTE